MIICVTPNPAIDHTLSVPCLRPGDVMRATHANFAAGGKGINAARAIRTLGGEPLCMGFLGGETGGRIETLAQQEGLRASWTWAAGESRTCVIVAGSDGESTVINEDGPYRSASDWLKFSADVIALAPGNIVSCSGSLSKDSPLELWERLLRSLQSSAKSLWVDTSGIALLAAAGIPGVNLKINVAEAAGFLRRPVGDVESAMDAATSIRNRGAATVVLTLGKLGAVLADAAGTIYSPAPVVNAVNSVGSGDSFLGAFLVALDRGTTAAEALCWGIAAGAANSSSSGGAHFELEAFVRLYEGGNQLDLNWH